MAFGVGLTFPHEGGRVTVETRGLLFALDVAQEAETLTRVWAPAPIRALRRPARRAARRVRRRVVALTRGRGGAGRAERLMAAVVRDTAFLAAVADAAGGCKALVTSSPP